MRKLVLTTALLLLFIHCRGRERAETTQATAAAPAPASMPAVTIRANGAELATISESAGVVEIKYSGHTLRGETRDSGKRKYTRDGGNVMYEVKPADEGDGFKLRLFDGALRWKVKVTPEKIKISDNEQNENPFELKPKDAGRTKVVGPGDVEIGNVRSDGVENAAGRKLFTVEGAAPSAACGVLLLEKIPQEEQLILVAELRSRGR